MGEYFFHFHSVTESTAKQWIMSDFRLVSLTSTDALLCWNSSIDGDGSASILKITAQPNDSSLNEIVQITMGSLEYVYMLSLRPFTLYNFTVKDNSTDAVLAEIGPIRTWPVGKLQLIY